MSAHEDYEEALLRIAEAKRTNAEILDLGDLQLEALPESLGELTAITSLYMSGCQGITDVSALRKLTTLTELNLSDCSNLRSFEPLRGLLPNLEMLYLYGCNFEADGIPLSVCGEGWGENVLDAVRAHYLGGGG